MASLLTQIRLASQNLQRSIHRDAVIVAALMAAIAMTVGISVMIFAFRRTVEVWIDRAIAADIFMTPSANETFGNGAFFPPEVLAALRREPSIRTVDTVREIGINVRGDRVSMAVVEGNDQNRLAFVGGGAAEKQAAFYQPEHVLVSEPFAHRYHVGRGRRAGDPDARRQREFHHRGSVLRLFARRGHRGHQPAKFYPALARRPGDVGRVYLRNPGPTSKPWRTTSGRHSTGTGNF